MNYTDKIKKQTIMHFLSASTGRSLFGQSTHEGAAKKPNEDAHSVFSVNFGNEACHVLIVADGVTSQSGSQQASQLAIDTIRQTIEAGTQAPLAPFSHEDLRLLLEQSIIQADKRIKEVARVHASGMSTTVVVALIVNNTLYVAHVGDSRAYLARNQSLHLLTRDHTYVEEMIQQGKLARENAKRKTNRNVLTRYLGPGPVPEVDLTLISFDNTPENQPPPDHINLLPGDAILLCSDGLTDKVTEAEISHILIKNQHQLQKSADQLIQKALEKHETDNITAVLFCIPHQAEEIRLHQSPQPDLGQRYEMLDALKGRRPSRFLAWLVGLFLFTLMVVIVLALNKPLSYSATQVSKSTPTEHGAGIGILLQSCVQLPISTYSPTTTLFVSDTSVQKINATVFLVSPILRQEVLKNLSSPSPTITPFPTPTSTPIPTATSTPPPTLPSQAIVNQGKPGESSLPISNSANISATLSTISVKLISPNEGKPNENQTTPTRNFTWETNGPALPADYAFELIYWKDGQDPLKDGLGLVGAETTGIDHMEVDLTQITPPIKAGTYLWGIRIVKLKPTYEKIRFLGKQLTFTFNQ